ncbi:folate family ECF transporter S component [Spiroplasma taiwanense]|uniref:Folate family ECF transporter S component n=1 Tax=Spiroplasma taiwanense CT-1 TaxID=1276220 RepID=S5LYM5_9MOLU|nr:folate family ECF transporter S component [Spiroplasma taiwanense]AGR40762.1 hypothetical protein STAIW_v1c00670 [Spiroplasma taiwanense CT-1]
MNWYLITNIVGGISTLLILLISLSIENFSFKKISIRHLTIIALFASCSAIMTGLSYKIPPIFGNISIALGDWLIFLLGVLFGPLCGVISGICTDTLMSVLLPSSYGYHAGYMFGKCLLGFFGALVYLTKSENKILLKIIILYSLSYIFQSLVLNQIWMMSWKGNAAWVDLVVKLIKLPITLPIYISITYIIFKSIKPLLNRWTYENVWCYRHVNKNIQIS